MQHIRNFCIIAHIDHGKSTLADRLLEYTHTIEVTKGQMLDDMDLEQERGITIKSHAIQMEYQYQGQTYVLNLIDTPGHVDFSYEVSRSIAACEGALLVVDATQGVQAQTISNLYMAIDHDLEIIPVINKCDMPNAMPEEVEDEIVELIGCKREEIIRASGKTGMGVEDILKAVVERIPCPKGDENAPLQALIFDSVFNSFRGIIAYFKIVNGSMKSGDLVQFIKGDNKRNFTINIPDIIEYKDAPKNTLPTLTYKERVIDYISKNRNHPVLEKIKTLQQLTKADILALEQICWKELGTKEEYQKYVQRGGLICGDSVAAFIRSIIKVDRTKALELYSKFLNDSPLNPEQEEYVKCVLDYVCSNGDIMPATLYKEEPFSEWDIQTFFNTDTPAFVGYIRQLHNVIAV